MNVLNHNKIKFALLGCSRISKKHIEAINNFNERCVLKDVCDINPLALEETKSISSANAYTDYHEMLEKTDADCLIITTPNGLHYGQTIEASNAGLHVITEKPMAVNVKDAEEMIKISRENNTQLFVVKQVRFAEPIQMIKDAVKSDKFGKLYMVNLNVFWTRPQEFYDTADWRGSLEMDGGTLLNQGSHYIDLIDWLFGPVTEISSYCSTLGRDIESEDSSVINLKFKDGSLGSIAITVLTYPSNLECSLTIIGEKGTVKLGGPSLNKFKKWQFKEMSDFDKSVEKKAEYPSGFSHVPYYENILNVLQSGKKPETDGYEGIKSLKIIEAAFKSNQLKKSVNI